VIEKTGKNRITDLGSKKINYGCNGRSMTSSGV
jgi:hypothetical protein